MISISCTNCKALLTIDEAFAGGVCRCQYCGTIQTVPARGHENQVGSAVSGQTLGGSKAGSPRDRQTPGTGLDELADIVASSGLSGSGLSSRRLSRPTTAAPTTKKPAVPKAAIAIGAGIVVVALAAFLALRGGTSTDPTNPNTGTNPVTNSTPVDGGGGSPTTPAGARGPSFCGVPLGNGGTIIYVLDRGSGSRDIFNPMLSATLRSIASLGPERKFQVIFWSNGSDELIFPTTGPGYATEKRVDECRKVFDDVASAGATSPKSALEKAYASSPDAVVLATGKGPDLGDDDVNAATSARNNAPIKTYTFSLGEGGSEALKKIASQSGGEYRHVTSTQLDSF